eukprot:5528249-Pyramimonas_sp.AAC.1
MARTRAPPLRSTSQAARGTAAWHSSSRPWTRCRGCNTCEYNDRLDPLAPTCTRCNRPVRMHRSRSRSPSQ